MLIFLHGFGGDALTTWSEFVTQWPDTHGGWDLVFFGYPTCKFKISELKLEFKLDRLYIDEHVNSFRKFIEMLEPAPAITINKTLEVLLKCRPELRRPDDFAYSQIVLVAHSMGAVVCRRALILEKTSDWVSKSSLILFAPAHRGGKPLMFINALTGINWGSVFAETINFVVPTLGDLKPEGKFLSDLEEDTRKLVADGVEEPFIVDYVCWAIPDNVVVNKYFAEDGRKTAEEVKKKTHKEICKPTEKWSLPLTAMRDHLP
ncbi:MAG: hypothetical protein NTAFB01_28540 [Nitrospira sp.]